MEDRTERPCMIRAIETLHDNAVVYIPAVRFNAELVRGLLELTGGCTITQGSGHWRSPNGAIVTEQVHLVSVWYDHALHEKVRSVLLQIAHTLHNMGEEAVMVVINAAAAVIYYAD